MAAKKGAPKKAAARKSVPKFIDGRKTTKETKPKPKEIKGPPNITVRGSKKSK